MKTALIKEKDKVEVEAEDRRRSTVDPVDL